MNEPQKSDPAADLELYRETASPPNFLFSGGMLIGGGVLAVWAPDTSEYSSTAMLIVGLVIAAFGGVLLIHQLRGLGRQGPFLEFNPAGITLLPAAGQREQYRWSEVGELRASTQVIRGRHGSKSEFHYLCAFTDLRHDLLQNGGHSEQPDYVNADIIIDLGMFPSGKSRETASALAERANVWRDAYGAPEIEVDSSTSEAQLDELKDDIAKKRMKHVAVSILCMIGVIAFMALLEFL